MRVECTREQEVLDAIASRRWPERAGTALQDHVRSCALCADLAEIAGAFFEDVERAHEEARLPPAAVVWWKAQIRAREEAARVAARPIVVVQAAATICAAIASLLAAPAASTWMASLITSIGAAGWWALPADVSFSWLLSAAASVTLPLLIVGIWVVLAPVVVYLALDE